MTGTNVEVFGIRNERGGRWVNVTSGKGQG